MRWIPIIWRMLNGRQQLQPAAVLVWQFILEVYTTAETRHLRLIELEIRHFYIMARVYNVTIRSILQYPVDFRFRFYRDICINTFPRNFIKSAMQQSSRSSCCIYYIVVLGLDCPCMDSLSAHFPPCCMQSYGVADLPLFHFPPLSLSLCSSKWK